MSSCIQVLCHTTLWCFPTVSGLICSALWLGVWLCVLLWPMCWACDKSKSLSGFAWLGLHTLSLLPFATAMDTCCLDEERRSRPLHPRCQQLTVRLGHEWLTPVQTTRILWLKPARVADLQTHEPKRCWPQNFGVVCNASLLQQQIAYNLRITTQLSWVCAQNSLSYEMYDIIIIH